VEEPIAVYEVGVEGLSPLTPPPSSPKVTRLADGQTGDGPTSRSIDETIAQIPKSAASEKSPHDSSAFAAAIRNPKVLAGLGLAAAGLLALIVFQALPSGDGATSDTGQGGLQHTGLGQSGGQSGADDPVPVSGNAAELLANALASYETDEAEAVDLFREAIKIDPELAVVPKTQKSGHKSGVFFADTTSDGKFLITVADVPLLWNMAGDGAATVLPGHDSIIEALAVSPRDDRLVTAGYDKIPRVWNLTVEDIAGTALPLAGNSEGITGHADGVRGVAWHPNDSYVFTVSNDPSIGIWKLGRATPEAPNGQVAKANRIMTNETMVTVVVDPGGRWLVTMNDPLDGSPAALAYRMSDVISTLDREAAPEPIRVTPNSVQAKRIAFASDHDGNAVLVVGDANGSVSLYEMSDTPELLSRANAHADFVESLRVVPGENLDVIVSGSADGSTLWWQTGATNREQTKVFSEQAIASVDVTSDGRWVASGSHDGSVWLWDAMDTNFKATRLPTDSMVHVVRFDPQSRWLMAGCDDGNVYIWDLKRAKLTATVKPSDPMNGDFDGPPKTIQSQPLTMLGNE
jgi:WD40 repeat protein